MFFVGACCFAFQLAATASSSHSPLFPGAAHKIAAFHPPLRFPLLHSFTDMSVPLENLTVLRYQEIIDGVVGRVKPSFNEEGIDE